MAQWIGRATDRAAHILSSSFRSARPRASIVRLSAGKGIVRLSAGLSIVGALSLGGCFQVEDPKTKSYCLKNAGVELPPNYLCAGSGGFVTFPASGGTGTGGNGSPGSGGTNLGTGGLGMAGESNDCPLGGSTSASCLGGMGGDQ